MQRLHVLPEKRHRLPCVSCVLAPNTDGFRAPVRGIHQGGRHLIAVAYLPTFGKLTSGHLRCDLEYDCEAIIARVKPSPFCGSGVWSPENFENRDCQIRIF